MTWFDEKGLWPAFQRVNNLLKGKADENDVSVKLGGKVDKVEGKGLSTNDYTDEEKSKLDGLEAGAQVNVIEVVKRNGTALTPDANNAVDVTVPTKVSDLLNDSGFQTAAQVQSAADAAVDPILSDAVTYGPASLVTISDGIAGMPFKRLYAAVQLAQSGSGDPSPSNVRSISGWDAANLVLSPTTTAGDGTTYNFDFSSSGTVYGGTLDVLTGVLTVDKKVTTVSALSWSASSLGAGMFFSAVSDKSKTISEVAAEAYKYVTDTPSASFPDNSIRGYVYNTASRIFVHDSRYSTAAAFKTDMGTMKIVYALAEPVTYQLTRQQITSLAGANNIWCDAGEVTVEYGAFLPAIQQEIEGQDNSMDDRVDALEAVITAAGPILIQNAEDITAVEGDDAIFSVRAAGSNLTYKWELYYSSSWTYPNFPGRDTPNMTVTATSSRNGYRFRCTITGGGWTVYSKTVTLHVTS